MTHLARLLCAAALLGSPVALVPAAAMAGNSDTITCLLIRLEAGGDTEGSLQLSSKGVSSLELHLGAVVAKIESRNFYRNPDSPRDIHAPGVKLQIIDTASARYVETEGALDSGYAANNLNLTLGIRHDGGDTGYKLICGFPSPPVS